MGLNILMNFWLIVKLDKFFKIKRIKTKYVIISYQLCH